MSGKAPPRGPRALLASLPLSGPAVSSQSQPQPQQSRNAFPSTSVARLGAVPPTGPRSLTNGIYPKQPPQGPKHLVGQPSIQTNTPGSSSLSSNALSNGRHSISIKGKNPENVSGWSTSGNWQSTSGQANGWHDSSSSANDASTSTTPSVSNSVSRPAISISIPTGSSGTKVQASARGQAANPSNQLMPLLADSLFSPVRQTFDPPPPPPSQPPPPPPPPEVPPEGLYLSESHSRPPSPAVIDPPPPPPPSEAPPQPPPPILPHAPPPPSPEPSLLQSEQLPHLPLDFPLRSDPTPLLRPPSPPVSPPPAPPSPIPPSKSHPSTSELIPPPPTSEPPPIPPPSPPPLLLSGHELPPSLPPSEVQPHAPISFELTSASKLRQTTSVAPALSSSLLEEASPQPSQEHPEHPDLDDSPHVSPSKSLTPVQNHPKELESAPEPKAYSLPPLPSWPPPLSECPPGRNFKVIYDPAVEGSSSTPALIYTLNSETGQPVPLCYRALIEHIRKQGDSVLVQERIRGKGKGKELLYRLEGEIFEVEGQDGLREPEVVVRDPRKEEGFKRMPCLRPGRNELYELKYEYDQNSIGPPPPTQVLVTNMPPLLPNQHIRRHFSVYGQLLGFEPQIDKENGGPLGIVLLKYGTHEEAKKCVAKENGKKACAVSVGSAIKVSDDGEIRAVLDGEGLKLKAVLKELDERKKKEREEKRKREKSQFPAVNGTSATNGSGSVLGKTGTSTPQTPLGQTPNSSTQWRGHGAQSSHLRSGLSQSSTAVASSSVSSPATSRLPHSSLPQTSNLTTTIASEGTSANTSTTTNGVSSLNHPLPPPPPPAARRPPSSLVRARVDAKATPMVPYRSRRDRDWDRDRDHSRDRSRDRDYDRDWDRDRERGRGRDRDWRDRDRSRDWDRYRGRDRDWERDRDRDRDWDRDRDSVSSSSTPIHYDRDRGRDWDYGRDRGRRLYRLTSEERHYEPSPIDLSRSPSPGAMMQSELNIRKMGKGAKGCVAKEMEHDEVLRVLAKNGMEYVKVEGGMQLVRTVRDDDVKTFFEGFHVDQVLRDRQGIYVTFEKPDHARRAAMVLGSRTLAYQSVTLTVHSPPADVPEPSKTKWEKGELVEQAQQSVIRELRTLLEKDITDRVVAPMLRRFVAEEKEKSRGEAGTMGLLEQKPLEKKGLKGLSFKKQHKKEVVRGVKVTEPGQELHKDEEEEEEEEGVVERPKKRRKTEPVKKARKIIEDELESEEEDVLDPERLTAVEELVKKRAASEDRDEVEGVPLRKKLKREEDAPKIAAKRKFTKKPQGEVIILPDGSLPTPPEASHVTSGLESSESRSPTPTPVSKRLVHVVTPPPTPPPDPFAEGLCEDDEDLYFAKLVLSGFKPLSSSETEQDQESSTESPSFRKHVTGSARTEGFYKISHKEKAAYVAQYQSRSTAAHAAIVSIEEPPLQPVISSRENRANARRRAQGLEEINQVQRAVALSKGETGANELTFKFNQLQSRKKHLRFARSPIHDWGLYAMEKISKGEMVIEYVGEIIRAQVADKREKAYERQGIGSSYLFRIDEDLVVDATKKGNLGRLINHSCDPNCTAKIIMINGEKKIVIYAKQDIELGEEITYDYHFPFEQDKIPCLCGSAKCRGYLN